MNQGLLWSETESHNAPSYVAGVLEEYGKERPSTSKAELMVLALSNPVMHSITSRKKLTYEADEDVRVHPATSPGTRTRVPDDVKALFLRDFIHSKCASPS